MKFVKNWFFFAYLNIMVMSRVLGLISILIAFNFPLSAQLKDRNDSMPLRAGTSDTIFFFHHFLCTVLGKTNVSLSWKAEHAAEGDYFIVERSYDGVHYQTIGIQRIMDTATQYMLNDNSPLNGVDYYRLTYSSRSGLAPYSEVRQVSLSEDVNFRFYPNPVDKLLIIRTEHNISIQINDILGATRINMELTPGLQVINVSSLEKGTYVLKIADKESNRVISEQLLKN